VTNGPPSALWLEPLVTPLPNRVSANCATFQKFVHETPLSRGGRTLLAATWNELHCGNVKENLLLHLLSGFFKPLLGLTRSRGRYWAAIRLSHRPEPSGPVVHDEVDGLDIGGQHCRPFVLLRHTHRSQPICTSRSHAHLYKQDQKRPTLVRRRLSRTHSVNGRVIPGWWVPVSGIKMRNLVGISAHSTFHWWSAHCASRILLRSDKPMSCCAAGTNGCLDLRRRAFALDGRVSAEWSRCPGSMARSARDSVGPLRRSSAGWMPARTGRLSAGVGRRHPVIIRKA